MHTKGPVSGLARYYKRLPLLMQLFGVALGLALVSVAAASSARYYDYVQNDPNFCRSCHTMQTAWDRWSQSAHNEISCHKCHQQNDIESMQLVVKYVIRQPKKVERHAFVSDETCAKCHESNNPRWLQIAGTAGHQKHAEEGGIACTKCHSVTLHRFEPPKQICGVCHTEQQIKIREMASLHCLTCHDFLSTGPDLMPERESCLSCHDSLPRPEVNWPSVAPMKWKCGSCHKPHEQLKPIVDCVSCHQSTKSDGLHAGPGHAATACESCHRPHAWKITTPDVCLPCHTGEAVGNQLSAFSKAGG